ncbi:MAG: DUF1963 domain-containing protein [Chloroflexi bacterium]|nr:DUF1963 domain-containing protein [Chloroflexota bacterium]
MATKEQIREAFIAEGFSSIVDDLEPLMKDAIGIIGEIKQDDQEIPVGASKLGGAPDLPSNEQWPYWQDGEPLSFICQLNLAEVTQHDVQQVLPTSGMLYFFCDAQDERGVPPVGLPEEQGRWKVIYFDGDLSTLKRTPLPQEWVHHDDLGLDEDYFAPHAVSFYYQATIPSLYIHREKYSIGPIDIMDSTDKAESDALFDKLDNMYQQILLNPSHQLLGHPNEIQENDMRIGCQLASQGRDPWYHPDDAESAEFMAGLEQWRLFLQIDSTKGYTGQFGVAGGMCWADGGIIYLWIREQDLRSKKFENAWLALEST